MIGSSTLTKSIYLMILVISGFVYGQSVQGHLELSNDYFYNFETFYLADFDFNDAQSNPEIFSYTLSYEPDSPGGAPARIKIEFELCATVPTIALENDRLFYVRSTAFDFSGSLKLTSQTVDITLDHLYYENGAPIVGLSVEEGDFFTEEKFKALSNTIFSGGKLMAGDYFFILKILNEDNQVLLGDTKLIRVNNPSELQLVSPGEKEISSAVEVPFTYPLFEWDSEEFMWNDVGCPDCGYKIRVAEYDPQDRHSSFQAALEDVANLPFGERKDQYYELPKIPVATFDNMTIYKPVDMFQYPSTSDAKALEEGKTYVWKLLKTFPTTSGSVTQESEIFVFTIPSSNQSTPDLLAAMNTDDEYSQLLEQILGAGLLAQLLNGELRNYTPTGNLLLNDVQSLNLEQLKALVAQISSGNYEIKNVKVE